MAKISIIIPTLNEEVGIKLFLERLQAFRPDCELILVDGGSQDNTIKCAESYVDDVIKSSLGRGVQMNVGAKAARAPILLFLHADTYLPVDAINKIQFALSGRHCWGRFDIALIGQTPLLTIVCWMMNKRSYLTGIATGDQAIFVKKSVFEKIGGFADIALMEDIDLSARLKKQSRPYCVRSKVRSSARRWLSFGIIKTILLMWWLRLRYFLGAKPADLEKLYRKGRFWKF